MREYVVTTMGTGEVTCPVCDEGAATSDELKVHLHVDHRKSELVELFLEAVEDADRKRLVPA